MDEPTTTCRTVGNLSQVTGSDRELIEKAEESQKQLRTRVAQTRRFSDEEKRALDVASIDAFDEYWASTGVAQKAFHDDHATGGKKFARRAMYFGSEAHDTLRSLSPIADFIKDISAPYGTLVIGTIAFVVAIAKNRSRMERIIGTTLETIGDRLSGLRLYRKIYNDRDELDQELQNKIVQAYNQFTAFCIVAVEFYSASGLRRWRYALVPSQELDTLANGIQIAFKHIREKCEDLLNKNVAFIKQINLDQKQQIQGESTPVTPQIYLNDRIQKMAGQNRLHHIRTEMGMERYSSDAETKLLKQYHEDLGDDPSVIGLYVEHMTAERADQFRKGSDYCAWSQSLESSMLILTGYNNYSIMESAVYCWMSPLAMSVYRELQTVPHATGDFCAMHVVGLRKGEGLSEIIFSLLLQLLKSHPTCLLNDDQYSELSAELQLLMSKRSEPADVVRFLQKIAIRLLNLFHTAKTIWLLVDRVHNLHGEKRFDPPKLMEILAYLVNSAKVRVRVLVIVDGNYWRLDRSLNEIQGARSQRIISHVADQQNTGGVW